jgi:hypothetical protein
VLASWVLLAAALGLLAAGTLYTEAVTIAGLQRELAGSPVADRSIVVRTQILPERLAAAEDAIVPRLGAALSQTGGELARVLGSAPFAEAGVDPEAVTQLVVFGSYEGIDRHATLTAGAWPRSGGSPVEVAVSEPAAALLRVAPGDRLALVGRLDGRTVDAIVVGLWRADPTDPYWLGEGLVLAGSDTGGSFTRVGPLVADEADLLGSLAGARPIDAQWRAIPSLDGFRPDNLGVVAAAADSLAGEIGAAVPSSTQVQVATKLPAILGSVDRSVLVSQAGILLLFVQFGVLAGYAVVLVAALLVDRRRTGTALLRARGAGFGHLVRMAAAEAALVVVPAALAAPWIATGLVALVRLNPVLAPVGLTAPLPGPATFAVAAVAGVLAIVALTLPTLAGGVSIAGVRVGVGRQLGRTLPQRLGLDLALVVLAAIALLQLRLYGAPLTRNARGALGVDPLLVAAPAIGLLGGAVLAIRLVPRLAELAERVLARGRGLVGSLGGRQLARRPLRYTRAALLLVLAAALGTFASAHAATWGRSQADQAAYAAGADLRLGPGPGGTLPDWAQGEAIRAIPGVAGATSVVRASVSLGSAVRDGTLLGVDGPALAGVLRLPAGQGSDDMRVALRSLADGRPSTPGLALPDGSRRLSILLGSDLRPGDGTTTVVPAGLAGLRARAIVVDGDGRIASLEVPAVALNADPVRVEIPLAVPGTAGSLRAPVHLLAVDLELSIASLTDAILDGTVTLHGLATSPDDTGDRWVETPVGALDGLAWAKVTFDSRTDITLATPGVLPVRSVDPANPAAWRASLGAVPSTLVAALANGPFLDATGARPGDTLKASVFGRPVTVRLLDEVDGFPSQAPSKPLLLVDGPSLDLVRFAGDVSLAAGEWWVGTAAGTSGAVATAAEQPPLALAVVADRASIERDLAGDPLGLGVVGILGLGSMAALIFAAIGYLVTTTVSTQERLGELALLKALGLAPRQLLTWLTLESAALLVVGLASGVGLGVVLAWLALPFATLTPGGEPPVPSPVVIVPADALVPVAALGVVLVGATVLLVRRLVPAARTSAVLRARDE